MIEPLNNYLLVEVEKEEEKTSGGLYMPQGTNASATDILKKGKVIKASKKVLDKLLEIGVDTKKEFVYYNKHAITKIPGETNLVFVRFEDVYSFVD